MQFRISNSQSNDPLEASYSELTQSYSTGVSSSENETTRTSKFISLSLLLHGVMVGAALITAALQIIPKIENQPIVVEFEVNTPKGTQTKYQDVAKGRLAEAKSSKTATNLGDVATAPAHTASAVRAKTRSSAKTVAHTRSQHSPSTSHAKSERASKAVTPHMATPTLDDIQAPELANVKIRSNKNLVAADVDRLADDENKKFREMTKKELSTFHELEKEMLDSNQQSVDDIKSNLAADDKVREDRINQQIAEDRAKEANLAAKKAAERAEASRLAALAASANENGNGTGTGGRKGAKGGSTFGDGTGTSGGGLQTGRDRAGAYAGSNEDYGIPGGVKKLDQIRQMPGNPKPAYAEEDRFAKREGDITVLAYVTSGGSIQKMRVVKKTGYQTLDAKTIAAISKWKFYPGQEGWVEIPTSWQLKGSAVFNGKILRTSQR